MTADLSSEFSERRALYEEFAACLHRLLGDLSKAADVRLHSLTWRAKSVPSLVAKLQRKAAGTEQQYDSLDDVTDLVGVRAIAYFEDHVGEFVKLVEEQFQVDAANSSDKLAALSADQFGYRSVHLVVSLSPPRSDLPEYERYKGLKAEVQVRSILQHAWAEIEHDLGYKTAAAVPAHLRRRFSRLAGLLELADEEFAAIRIALDEHRASVSAAVGGGASLVTIDRDSIRELAVTSELVRRADLFFAECLEGTVAPGSRDPELHSVLATALGLAGYVYIDALEEALRENEPQLRRFAEEIAKRQPASGRGGRLVPGIGLFHLAIYTVIRRLGKDGFKRIVERAGLDFNDTDSALFLEAFRDAG